jgi:hypothetical protein
VEWEGIEDNLIHSTWKICQEVQSFSGENQVLVKAKRWGKCSLKKFRVSAFYYIVVQWSFLQWWWLSISTLSNKEPLVEMWPMRVRNWIYDLISLNLKAKMWSMTVVLDNAVLKAFW